MTQQTIVECPIHGYQGKEADWPRDTQTVVGISTEIYTVFKLPACRWRTLRNFLIHHKVSCSFSIASVFVFGVVVCHLKPGLDRLVCESHLLLLLLLLLLLCKSKNVYGISKTDQRPTTLL
jgi:hypothetical protein